MGIIVYVLISIVMFVIGYNCAEEDKNKIAEGVLFGAFWPLALIYLFFSLFYGAGKYL